MFRTLTTDLVGVPGAFGGELAYWASVSRILRTHWYHLTVRVEQEGRSTESTVMIEGEAKLQQMLIGQDEELAIIDLQAVTPGWMNKSSGWKMERVKRISVGEDDGGFSVCLIEVDDGAVYHSSHSSDFQAELLTNQRPIFLSAMIRAE